MRALSVIAFWTGLGLAVLPACKINLDHTPVVDGSGVMCTISTSTACMDATSHQELSWLQTNVFSAQCVFSGCHNGGNTDAGHVDLRDGMSYTHLVGATSKLEPSRKLVVAGDTSRSYLMVMLGKIKPSDAVPPAGEIRAGVGLMPQNNGGNLICCQKLDAVDRWITAGAMNN